MEFLEEHNKEERGIEKFVLMGFTLYNIMMIYHALQFGGQYWIPFVLFICITAAWIINLINYKNYSVRTMITAFLINISLVVFGVNYGSYESFLPLFFTLMVLISIYGIPDYTIIGVVSITIITINTLITKGNQIPSDGELTNFFIVMRQAGNIVLFEIVIAIWLKNRHMSSKKTRSIIEALQRAERTKDDFLANISHEIRTPVNTISGMSEIILQENDINKIKEYVRQIYLASGNLMSVVSDVLDFSELQTGELAIEEEYYNISSTINDLVNMAVALKGEKKIEIIVNLDPKLPKTLCGDEKKIRRVIMNLLSNAIKFTDSGYVELNVTGRKESYGINLFVVVKDTGIGIREGKVDQLFSSFGQNDSTRSRTDGGIGLGLAISKAITDKLGGVISVKSKLGAGSSFSFVVPQKIIDDSPVVEIADKDNYKAICYINMEQFRLKDIRDAYTNNIMGVISGIDVDCLYCNSIEELKRRVGRDKYTHMLISYSEYLEDTAFFEEVSKKCKLAVVTDRMHESVINNENVYKMLKPCYVLQIASFFNNRLVSDSSIKKSSFVAPDAHILVVDDNLMNIKVIEGLLKRYGIKVTYALSGAEALEKIETLDYDFVFMDHMMPEMDGIETLHRIRAKIGTYYNKVPVVALTANAVAGSRDLFMKEGFSDFLEKPVEVSVLERVLKRNIPESKIIYDEVTGKKNNDKREDKLSIGDLKVENGILYCGGEESYISILKECCSGYSQTRQDLDKLYTDRDWKNYIIKIHALKSTMKSIGADICSDMAAKLEAAGKNDNFGYILDNHDDAMKTYEYTMHMIAKSGAVNFDEQLLECEKKPEPEETDDGLEEMTSKQMAEFIKSFQEAMYSLDVDTMKSVIISMSEYKYNNRSLKGKLAKVLNKVEQADYFSAGDLLEQIIHQLSEG